MSIEIEFARQTGKLGLNIWQPFGTEEIDKFKVLRELVRLSLYIGDGIDVSELVRILLLGNPRLRFVYIRVNGERCTSLYTPVLCEWFRSCPSDLHDLTLVRIQLDDEACAALGGVTGVRNLGIYPPPPAPRLLALAASMRALRNVNIPSDVANPWMTFELVANLLREHPVLSAIDFSPEVNDYPCPPGLVDRLALEHGVIHYIGGIPNTELRHNRERRTTDWTRRVPWPYGKVVFLGDPTVPGFDDAPMYRQRDSFSFPLAPADELVSVLHWERDMINSSQCPGRAPPAAYDPALNPVFTASCKVPAPVPVGLHEKSHRIRLVDLRGVANPLIPYDAKVVLVIDMSLATVPGEIDDRCRRLCALAGGDRVVLLWGKSRDDPTPEEEIHRRVREHVNALSAIRCFGKNRSLVRFPALMGVVGDACSPDHFAEAARAAAHAVYDHVPYSWATAAALLVRADADGRAVIPAAEWAGLLASCDIEAQHAPAVLAITSRAAPFHAVAANGAVLFLRDNERLAPFFVPPSNRAMRALRDAGLLRVGDRAARQFYLDGHLTPVMAKVIYADALCALGRGGAALELPDADTVMALLVAARIVSADAFVQPHDDHRASGQ